jgi:uncharacterized repeat protein (TIGR03803 family)
VLHSFSSGGGGTTFASLTFDPAENNGTLYGTTFSGGTDSAGSVFEITP